MDNRTFIDKLSHQMDVSRDTVSRMIETLAETMGECGSELDSIVVPNFGVFEARKRQERVAVHPASGKKLLIPPRVAVIFKSSPVLKQRINDGK